MNPQVQLLGEFLELQLSHGVRNGELIATHRSLEAFGLEYRSIKGTIDEAVSAGYVEKTLHGHGGAGTRFRLLKTPDAV